MSQQDALDPSTYDIKTPEGAERFCRDFVQKYPTKITTPMVEVAEAGRVSWVDVAEQFDTMYKMMRR